MATEFAPSSTASSYQTRSLAHSHSQPSATASSTAHSTRPNSQPSHQQQQQQSRVRHSHRDGHALPRQSPGHWSTTLARSPQLCAELAAAGVNVSSLIDYAAASKSKSIPLERLSKFLDPKPRGAPMSATGTWMNQSQYEDQQHQRALFQGEGDWNPSKHIDWRVVNGSRELSLLATETALEHPESNTARIALDRLNGNHPMDSYRNTDIRTGHRLDYVLPTKIRFEHDAYYNRIVDLRKSQEGKAPHRRLPPPRLYNGFIVETEPTNEDQRKALEAYHRSRKARADYLSERTQQHYGIHPDPTIKSPYEWQNTQQKKQAIKGCPSASDNTYNRLFHLDLPPPMKGKFLSERSPAGLAREQNIRDRSSHGRDYYPLSNVIIETVPTSLQARTAYELSRPNAMGRLRQDEKLRLRRSQEEEQTNKRNETTN